MTHPVFIDDQDVDKGAARASIPLRLADNAALRALDLTSGWLVFIDGTAWQRDAADTISADDDATVIVDAAGNRWKLATSGAGDVVGPVSSTTGNLASYAGTGGDVLADSGVAPSTDGTFAANSDAKLPTEKAVKTYVTTIYNTILGGVSAAFDTLSEIATDLGLKMVKSANLSDVANAATARTNLGVAIGTDVQAYNAGLADIAGLAKTDGNIIVGDGANWVAESGATARTSLGLAIGTDVQAYDAELAALAGLTSAADKVPYFTGSGAAAVGDFTAAGRSMVAAASAAAQTALLSALVGDSGSGGTKGLAPAPGAGDSGKFLRGDATWVTIPGGGDLLAANNLSDLASASTARTNLGVAIGIDVQAYNAELAAIAALGAKPLGNFRNLLINPYGRFNQRAPASNADDTYGHDRWYALTQTDTIAVSTVADAENGTPRMWRLTQSQAVAQRMGYAQIIEGANCRHLRGKQVTLSGRIKYSNAAAVRYAILEWTGTEDVVTSDVVNDWTSATFTAGNFFNSTSLTVSAVETITPSAATLTDLTALTATLGSSFNNLIVLMWTEGTAAQNSTLDGALQLEQGASASTLEHRSVQIEENLCWRYYFQINSASGYGRHGIGKCQSTTQGLLFAPFPMAMRVGPSFSTTGTIGNFAITAANGAATTLTNLTLNSVTRYIANTVATVASGMVAGNATELINNGASGTSINFSAEL